MDLITETTALEAFCARLANAPFITVDTEFMRETTYYPKLCLIQVASSEEIGLIDPLAPGLDLAAFFALMRAPGVVKVFHAARQDIETFWNVAQTIPAPLFDTQVAAMVCGFGDQVGYEAIAASLAGAKIDKSSRFTDWARRPLSEAQLTYAAADVTHLRKVYEALIARLKKTGRSGWVSEEMATLTDPATYRNDPDLAYERLKSRVRRPRDLGVLMELAAWREREAQARDVPRGRILKDDLLMEIVSAAPANAQALAQLRGLPAGFERSRGAEGMLDAVRRGLARDPASLPPLEARRQLSNGAAALVSLLKVLLQATADRNQVASKVLASAEDLERIATEASPDTPVLAGWRFDIFGKEAMRLKRGEIALTVRGGRIDAVALPRPASEDPAAA
jgi:ribonuclease D